MCATTRRTNGTSGELLVRIHVRAGAFGNATITLCVAASGSQPVRCSKPEAPAARPCSIRASGACRPDGIPSGTKIE
jgi:hypothetical protein